MMPGEESPATIDLIVITKELGAPAGPPGEGHVEARLAEIEALFKTLPLTDPAFEALLHEYVNLVYGVIVDLVGDQEVGADELRRVVASEVQSAYILVVDDPATIARLDRFVDEQLDALIAKRGVAETDTATRAVRYAADPVMLFNGQFVHEAVDVRIDGAGIDFAFRRIYKNQVVYDGPLGFNWSHNLNLWLRVADATIFRSTEGFREDAYVRHPKFGQAGFDYWIPPDGRHGVIVEHGNSFIAREPDGVRYVYEPDPAHAFLHRIVRIEDRHGNFLACTYDGDQRLQRVGVNHPERTVEWRYDARDRIVLMTDHTGRQWRYAYDDFGDLVAVTGPATDRHPAGLTACYEYSSSRFRGRLRHNLTRIIDASGRMYLENEYGTEPGRLSFDRVIRQRQGGGETLFEYEDVIEDFTADYTDENRPAHQTNVIDRNGQAVHHIFNRFGNVLFMEEVVVDSGLPRRHAWRYRYDRDGALVGLMSPEGTVTQYLYGREHFIRRFQVTDDADLLEPLTAEERLGFGRLLAVVRRGRYYGLDELNLSIGLWSDIFPDILGAADPANAIVKFTYVPTYGQVRTVSDPRFTLSADPAAQTHATGEHPDYERTCIRYEYTGPPGDPADPLHLARIVWPTPTPADGTAGQGIIDQLTAYDARGRLLRHVDPAGTVTEYGYFPGGPGELREGHLQRAVVDPGGLALVTEFEVDGLGRGVSVRLPRAAEVTDDRFVVRTAYNALDQVIETAVAAPQPLVTRRFYDPSGMLEREVGPIEAQVGIDGDLGEAVVRTYCYDEEFNVVEETIGGTEPASPERLTTRHQYDGAGRRSLTILPVGNRLRYRYDARHFPVAVTAGAGSPEAATHRAEVDGDGRVLRTFDARGNPFIYTLDPFGRSVAEENGLGHVVRRDFDKLGNVKCERVFEKRNDGYVLLSRSETAYDELGRPTRHTVDRMDDPPTPVSKTQLATAFLASPPPGSSPAVGLTIYDAKGRVTRTVDPLGRSNTYQYDAVGRLHVETDPLGNRAIRRYDRHNNLLRRDRVDVELDPGNPLVVIGERVLSTSFTYDSLDRRASSADGLGNVTHFACDGRGNGVRRVDPLGNVVLTEYDAFDRRIADRRQLTTTGAGGGPPAGEAATRFAYDGNHNLVRVVDPLGRVTRYEYDALDRRRGIVYADGSRFAFEYDRDGHLVRTTDDNGVVRHHTVDAMGRLTRVDVDLSGVANVQVGGATFERYAYDGLGRQVVAENDFARCVVDYDSLGSPVTETIHFTTADVPLQGPFEIRRAFDDAGARTDLIYPSGRHLRVTRDDLDRPKRVHSVAKGAGYPGDASVSDVHDIVSDVAYAGPQKSRTRLGNGAVTRFAHDGAGRIIDVEHAAPVALGSSGPLLRLQCLFDAAGNVRVRHDIRPAGSHGEAFAYDSLYRLVREADVPVQPFDPSTLAPAPSPPPDPIPHGQAAIDTLIGSVALPSGPTTFEYDPVGNRTLRRGNPEIEYDVNALDQYVRISALTSGTAVQPQYDASGNVTFDGRRAYTYDSLGRLVEVSEVGVVLARFLHDARGRRILEVAGGETTQLVYDDEDLIAEYRNGQPFALYVHDDGVDEPLHIAAEGKEHWYHADLLGSIRLLTDGDGDEAHAYRYAPYGALVADAGGGPYNPLRYTARRFDAGLDLYDYRARQYDPQLGRFLQRDPAGMIDGTHLYAYAGNNPLVFTDPSGTEREEANPASILEVLHELWRRAPIDTQYDVARALARMVGYSPAEVVAGEEIHMFERAMLHMIMVWDHYGVTDERAMLDFSTEVLYRLDPSDVVHDDFFLRNADLTPKSFNLMNWMLRKRYRGVAKIAQIANRRNHPITRDAIDRGIYSPPVSATAAARLARGDGAVFQSLTGSFGWGITQRFGVDYERSIAAARIGEIFTPLGKGRSAQGWRGMRPQGGAHSNPTSHWPRRDPDMRGSILGSPSSPPFRNVNWPPALRRFLQRNHPDLLRERNLIQLDAPPGLTWVPPPPGYPRAPGVPEGMWIVKRRVQFW